MIKSHTAECNVFFSKLKNSFPAYPLPRQSKYQEGMKLFSSSDASAYDSIIPFMKYTYKHHLSWKDCTWQDVIYPLDVDIDLIPCYIFHSSYTRYFLPSFLFISRQLLADEQYEIITLDGPSYCFNMLFWSELNENFKLLTEREIRFIRELVSIAQISYKYREDFKNSEFYKYGYSILKQIDASQKWG